MRSRLEDLQIKEIEFGHGFITFYGAPHQNLLELGRQLYPKLPKPLREQNREHLRHIAGDPNIFHPLGQPDELNKEVIHHFHVIYDRRPTNTDLEELKSICNKLGVSTPEEIPIKDILHSYKEDVNIGEAMERSKKLLKLWLEERTETINELLDRV